METYFNGMAPKSGSARRLWIDIRILLHDLVAWIQTKLGKKADQPPFEPPANHTPSPEILSSKSPHLTPTHKLREVAQRYPVSSVGIAIVAGIVVGLLLSRKD